MLSVSPSLGFCGKGEHSDPWVPFMLKFME